MKMSNKTFDTLRTIQSEIAPYAIAAVATIMGSLGFQLETITVVSTILSALNGLFGTAIKAFRNQYNSEKTE